MILHLRLNLLRRLVPSACLRTRPFNAPQSAASFQQKPLEKYVCSPRFYSFLLSPLKTNPTLGLNGFLTSFLKPPSPIVIPNQGMKQRGRPKLRCKGCYFVYRQDRKYVMCKLKPRHKQMAMKRRPVNTWILAHATQGKIRPW